MEPAGSKQQTALLDTLYVWVDLTPRSVFEQMALDHALFELPLPVLRVHFWQKKAVTFGYFQRWKEVNTRLSSSANDKLEVVRRFSGGGLVHHHQDQGVTLTLPTTNWRGSARFQHSQMHLHQALASALRFCGVTVAEIHREQGEDMDCFLHPVPHDLCYNGAKVLGAGQRRQRQGLLHQASLQIADLGTDWVSYYAHALAQNVNEFSPTSTLQQQLWQRSNELVQQYTNSSWQEKR